MPTVKQIYDFINSLAPFCTQESWDNSGLLLGNPEREVSKVSLALDAALTPWVAGKHYVYTLIFSLDEILINPSVADWKDVIVNDIPADVTEVATAAELVAAAAKGGDIVLTADIDLTASVEITQDVNLELNGKAINAASTDAIVVTNGANLTINGDGKVWAATNNASSASHGEVKMEYTFWLGNKAFCI